MLRISKIKLLTFMLLAIIAVLSQSVPENKEGEFASDEEVARIRAENGAPSRSSDVEFAYLDDGNLRSNQICLLIYMNCRGVNKPCCSGLICNPYFGFCVLP